MKKQDDKFREAPEINVSLYISLEEPDIVSIGSGERRITLNVQEAKMLRIWLNKALPR